MFLHRKAFHERSICYLTNCDVTVLLYNEVKGMLLPKSDFNLTKSKLD